MNNRGWGLAQMLILSSILIIALLIAAINSKRLEKRLEKNEIRNQIEEKQLNQDKNNNTTTSSSSETTTNDNDNNTDIVSNQTFITLEGLMVTSAQNLVNNNSLTISNDILIVKDEHLYEQDAELKVEMDKYKCRGYIKLYKENDNNYYIPYIKCSDYETTGYESSYN